LYQKLLGDTSLHAFMVRCDDDLAAEARRGGCPHCGGVLHAADYPRKPRGAAVEEKYPRRRSLCCARCRRRLTPPSLRFLGRRVYAGAVVVLATAMRHGPTPWRRARLRELVGVTASTLARWRTWWRETLPGSGFWRAMRGRFAEPVEAARLPASLLERFAGDLREQLVALLRWLGPVTTASAPGALPI
jgi:hypothetical protein